MDPRSPIRPRFALLAVIAAAALGCSGRAPVPNVPKPRVRPARTTPSPAFESSVPGAAPAAQAQARAQQQWCGYLEALYRRVTTDGTPWPRLGDCLAQGSTASVAMLEHTAACSRKALDGFEGDPLTDAYAQEVRRCGAEALEASTLSQPEIEPFTSVICKRAAACGTQDYAPCLADFEGPLGAKLRRAVGAINDESRVRLAACLEAAACQDATTQIAGCLEPIMDRLLWLPG
jgi:hypothetical protein